jgi:hypothetical protein
MRNYRLFFAALLLVFIGACSKEKNRTEPVRQLTDFDMKVGNNIKNFISKVDIQLKNPTLKCLETIDKDSALWYLEATFNYCYGFPNEFYDDFEIDTLGMTLDLTVDGRVNMTDLANKYNQMVQEISILYNSSGFAQRGLSIVNLDEVQFVDNYINFYIHIIIGRKGTIPPGVVIEGPFGDEDNWWYGEMEGKCDEFLMDSDAAQQLMLVMNATLPDSEGNFYVINPLRIRRIGGQLNVRRPNDLLDNQYDYYLFYGNESIGEVELCLQRNPMNIYFEQLRYLALQKIKEDEGLSALYSLINIYEMIGNYKDLDGNSMQKEYYHEAWFNYGIKVYYIDGDPYPTDL